MFSSGTTFSGTDSILNADNNNPADSKETDSKYKMDFSRFRAASIAIV